MVVNKNLVDKLTSLGLSEYESRLYLSLLRENPVTAYEAAKNGGIPTAKVYEVMARLIEKGLVTQIREAGKKLYSPLKAGEFLGSYRHSIEQTLDFLEEELQKIGAHQDLSHIWNINSRDGLMDKAHRMVNDAEETLLLSAWADECDELVHLLKERARNGVLVSVVLFEESEVHNRQDAPPWELAGMEGVTLFPHPIADTLYQEKGGRGFTLVVDGKAALIGTVREDDEAEGAWSENSGFVTVAEDYIKHDIYIMKIVRRFDRELIERFGFGYRKLRDIFSDDEI